jgi:hypothetical protein
MKFKAPFLIVCSFAILSATSLFSQEQNNDNERIKSMISKKRAFNKKYGFGYRIQLYNGIETRAKAIRSKFQVEFPGTKTYMRYLSPEWKTQIGNFKTKLEADKFLASLNGKFSGAIVVPLSNR